MALRISSLNSGSNGNCYYVGNESEAVLVDAGLSCREIEKRLLRLNLSIQSIKAIVISHEHSDHIKGVEVLSKKHRIPVYITPATRIGGRLQLQPELVKGFLPYEKIVVGSLTVTAFPKYHDAADPHSFLISDSDITIGVLTDIGTVCKHVIENFRQCHAVFLETNYDEIMLEEGHYPFHLKRRIRGGQGHLSNRQALELFLKHKSPALSHVLLSHLSRENNSPQLVQRLFEQHAGRVKVITASRDYETEVYTINESSAEVSEPESICKYEETQVSFQTPVQMSLF